MKKLAAILLALALPMCAVSCGDKPSESSSTAAVNLTAEMSFKTASIDMAGDFSTIYALEKRGSECMIFGELRSGETVCYFADLGFKDKRIVTFEPQDGENIFTACTMKYGKLVFLTTLDGSTMLYIYDKNGAPEKTFDLGELIGPNDHYARLFCTDDGFYINIDLHTLAFIDTNGNYKGDVKTGDRRICAALSDCDDVPTVILSDNSKTYVGVLDGMEITDLTDCGDLADYTVSTCAGNGDIRLYAQVDSGLYGLRENTWVKISDFADNDFHCNDIRHLVMTDDGEFAAVILGVSGLEMRLLSQRDISELKAKKVIKIAQMYSGDGDPYDDLMKKYNAQSEDYRIEPVVYNDRSGDYDKPWRDLKLDIVSGNAPDIIAVSGSMPVESYGDEEHVFVDLYSLMDSDPDISRGDFLDGFLEGYETNGKLLHVDNQFNIGTAVIKDKFANGLTSWNVEKFEQVALNRPEGMELAICSVQDTKLRNFYQFFGIGGFYDKQTATCSFDSEEFISAIKFIHENDIGLPEGQTASYSYGYDEEIESFKNDKALLLVRGIRGFNDLREYIHVHAGSEPITLIGSPTEEGINGRRTSCNSGFAILSTSENTEGAWDFLKYYLFSDESFTVNFWEFSGVERFYRQQLDDICSHHTHIDATTGEEVDDDYYVYWVGGTSPENPGEMYKVETPPFDDEQRAKYDAFVREAVKHPAYSDDVIGNIVDEELPYYFENQRSAEDTARIIQNRVEIYLSEQS